jgi:hypothetical protein
MKKLVTIAGTAVFFTCVAALILPCVALLEIPVNSTFERQIVINLSGDFQVAKSNADINTTTGFISQNSIIMNNKQPGGMLLSVTSSYDKKASKISPSSDIDLILVSAIEESLFSRQLGWWSTSDSNGHNITVHTMYINPNYFNDFGTDGFNDAALAFYKDVITSGGSYDLAYWNFDNSTQVLLNSYFPREITEKAIETLSIK